jgi:hypothetical protein
LEEIACSGIESLTNCIKEPDWLVLLEEMRFFIVLCGSLLSLDLSLRLVGVKNEKMQKGKEKRGEITVCLAKREEEKMGGMNDEYFPTGHSNLVIFPNWGEYNA